MKPRLLDLCCGIGGAARGYQMAGFHVTGVDIVPPSRYGGDVFIQANGLDYLAQYVWMYDAIHVSPPCEGSSQMTKKRYRGNHEILIPHFRILLSCLDTPWIIENVGGARRLLKSPFMLCGTMFGLPIWRHRYFETNISHDWLLPCCNHSVIPVPINNSSTRKVATKAECMAALEMDWGTSAELRKIIPPAYTCWIGARLMTRIQQEHPAENEWRLEDQTTDILERIA